MSNTNEEGWVEGMEDFYIAFDDVWSRMFVMSLGTAMPHNIVKNSFFSFIKERCMETKGYLFASEDDMISLFPEFLNEIIIAGGKA